MITAILCLLALIIGIGLARHYRDDAGLCTFADALITIAGYPLRLYREFRPATPTPPADAPAQEPPAKIAA